MYPPLTLNNFTALSQLVYNGPFLPFGLLAPGPLLSPPVPLRPSLPSHVLSLVLGIQPVASTVLGEHWLYRSIAEL